jgi:hypothetical protein
MGSGNQLLRPISSRPAYRADSFPMTTTQFEGLPITLVLSLGGGGRHGPLRRTRNIKFEGGVYFKWM